jgi:hypothetical protein
MPGAAALGLGIRSLDLLRVLTGQAGVQPIIGRQPQV